MEAVVQKKKKREGSSVESNYWKVVVASVRSTVSDMRQREERRRSGSERTHNILKDNGSKAMAMNDISRLVEQQLDAHASIWPRNAGMVYFSIPLWGNSVRLDRSSTPVESRSLQQGCHDHW